MAQVVQLGQINTAALQVADVYVQIVPPQFLLNGIPTNVLGIVGTASWGPVNNPVIVGGYADYAARFGQMQPRKHDMGTPVWTSYLQGGQAVYRCVRVTDGTDTAASVLVQTNCITFTSKHTGSLGNQQTVSIANGTAAGSKMLTVSTPGQVSEVFDNIQQGISSIAVTAGSGYTSVPALSAAAPPAGPFARPAQVQAALKAAPAPAVAVGGTGYQVGDVLTLPNGVVLTVATVTGGAVATVTLTNAGLLNAGVVPANPVAVSSATGAGTGATFTLAWVLGTPTIVDPGAGYLSAPALTLSGGGGNGGAYVATLGFWLNFANAINAGNGGLRGPSQMIVATAGAGSAAPVNGTVALSGGTDGANVNAYSLIGIDALPRKGMYALRGTGCSIAMLSDCDDATTWSTQIAFGLVEGTYMVATGPSADSISNAIAVKMSAGIDSYAIKLMLGDWIFLLDPVNGITRLVSPQGYVAGQLANLAPNQSTLNKPMQGIVGTQKSQTGVAYTTADLQALAQAGIDVICNPIPRGAAFGCRNGRNTSSNPAIRGDNYTRMTNFIAFTIAAGMGIYVGELQTPEERRRAKTTLDAYFSNLQGQGLIGNASGTDAWQVRLDDTNNPPTRVALGYQQADVKVQYLSVIEFFLINVEGGQTVTIQRSVQPVTP